MNVFKFAISNSVVDGATNIFCSPINLIYYMSLLFMMCRKYTKLFGQLYRSFTVQMSLPLLKQHTYIFNIRQ